MKSRLAFFCAFFAATMGVSYAQGLAASPKEAAAKPSNTPAPNNSSAGNAFSTEVTGPITTEIYSDKASFDSNNRVGVFIGNVKVIDPRFTLQSDKLTVHINKAESQGLENAVAEGNVAVVREKAATGDGPVERSVGRSDKAVYTGKTGDVELTGNPRVQQGMNSHVATSPDTVMVLNQRGQLTTQGPSRTEIHQEAKDEADKKEKKAEKNGDKKADAPVKP